MIGKVLNEQCSSVVLCAEEDNVNCNGGVCGCSDGYYDSNGDTIGGTCTRSNFIKVITILEDFNVVLLQSCLYIFMYHYECMVFLLYICLWTC